MFRWSGPWAVELPEAIMALRTWTGVKRRKEWCHQWWEKEDTWPWCWRQEGRQNTASNCRENSWRNSITFDSRFSSTTSKISIYRKTWEIMSNFYFIMHPVGEAYRDWRLTTNFELWVEIFLCADMFPYEDSKTMSVCLSVPWVKKSS